MATTSQPDAEVWLLLSQHRNSKDVPLDDIALHVFRDHRSRVAQDHSRLVAPAHEDEVSRPRHPPQFARRTANPRTRTPTPSTPSSASRCGKARTSSTRCRRATAASSRRASRCAPSRLPAQSYRSPKSASPCPLARRCPGSSRSAPPAGIRALRRITRTLSTSLPSPRRPVLVLGRRRRCVCRSRAPKTSRGTLSCYGARASVSSSE